MIRIEPSPVRVDATALVIYQGAPGRTVQWSLVGSGILEPLNSVTDGNGLAGARYTPAVAGETVTINVTAGS